MDELIRRKQSYYRGSIVAIGISLFLIIWPLLKSDEPPSAAFSLIGGLAMFTFGVLGAIAYRRQSLALGKDRICFGHFFGKRTVNLQEVVRARWDRQDRFPFLVLFFQTGREVLWLHSFAASDRANLVRRLHDCLPDEIQENWRQDLLQEVTDQRTSAVQEPRGYAYLYLKKWKVVGLVSLGGLGSGLALQICSAFGTVFRTWTGVILFDCILLACLGLVTLLAITPLLSWVFDDGDRQRRRGDGASVRRA
jgi:hypothetical protein